MRRIFTFSALAAVAIVTTAADSPEEQAMLDAFDTALTAVVYAPPQGSLSSDSSGPASYSWPTAPASAADAPARPSFSASPVSRSRSRPKVSRR